MTSMELGTKLKLVEGLVRWSRAGIGCGSYKIQTEEEEDKAAVEEDEGRKESEAVEKEGIEEAGIEEAGIEEKEADPKDAGDKLLSEAELKEAEKEEAEKEEVEKEDGGNW